jgi:hypothetical protein
VPMMQSVRPGASRVATRPPGGTTQEDSLHDRSLAPSELARRVALLPDGYLLTADDGDLVGFLVAGQNFGSSTDEAGNVTWGAFGSSFATLGELRALARAHPPGEAEAETEGADAETVGLQLFGNMLDTIAFLRVRLRALADVCIEKGLVSGPELLGKYHEYHERSFGAFRDLMLLRPEVFERRFAAWLGTEREYRERLAADEATSIEP